jgi:hypothetical protein
MTNRMIIKELTQTDQSFIIIQLNDHNVPESTCMFISNQFKRWIESLETAKRLYLDEIEKAKLYYSNLMFNHHRLAGHFHHINYSPQSKIQIIKADDNGMFLSTSSNENNSNIMNSIHRELIKLDKQLNDESNTDESSEMLNGGVSSEACKQQAASTDIDYEDEDEQMRRDSAATITLSENMSPTNEVCKSPPRLPDSPSKCKPNELIGVTSSQAAIVENKSNSCNKEETNLIDMDSNEFDEENDNFEEFDDGPNNLSTSSSSKEINDSIENIDMNMDNKSKVTKLATPPSSSPLQLQPQASLNAISSNTSSFSSSSYSSNNSSDCASGSGCCENTTATDSAKPELEQQKQAINSKMINRVRQRRHMTDPVATSAASSMSIAAAVAANSIGTASTDNSQINSIDNNNLNNPNNQYLAAFLSDQRAELIKRNSLNDKYTRHENEMNKPFSNLNYKINYNYVGMQSRLANLYGDSTSTIMSTDSGVGSTICDNITTNNYSDEYIISKSPKSRSTLTNNDEPTSSSLSLSKNKIEPVSPSATFTTPSASSSSSSSIGNKYDILIKKQLNEVNMSLNRKLETTKEKDWAVSNSSNSNKESHYENSFKLNNEPRSSPIKYSFKNASDDIREAQSESSNGSDEKQPKSSQKVANPFEDSNRFNNHNNHINTHSPNNDESATNSPLVRKNSSKPMNKSDLERLKSQKWSSISFNSGAISNNNYQNLVPSNNNQRTNISSNNNNNDNNNNNNNNNITNNSNTSYTTGNHRNSIINVNRSNFYNKYDHNNNEQSSEPTTSYYDYANRTSELNSNKNESKEIVKLYNNSNQLEYQSSHNKSPPKEYNSFQLTSGNLKQTLDQHQAQMQTQSQSQTINMKRPLIKIKPITCINESVRVAANECTLSANSNLIEYDSTIKSAQLSNNELNLSNLDNHRMILVKLLNTTMDAT